MYLVTGATGATGRHVVAGLRAEGADVRAIVRDPARADLPDGVERYHADLSNPSTLDGALADVETVFLVWPFFSTGQVSDAVDAIGARVRHVVYLSALAAADNPRGFWAVVEQRIATSGIGWTLLRPTGFAKNTLGWAEQIRAGVVRQPFGQARRSLIDERDTAAVAVRTMIDGGHAGRTYVLSGPESITQIEQVRLIGEAIGRDVRWEEEPPGEARPRLVQQFGDEWYADLSLRTWAGFVDNPEPVTSTVEELTGAPARPFAAWAVDHADAFTSR